MKIGVWGFTTQDVIHYHVLPFHPGCLLQVSEKTQNHHGSCVFAAIALVPHPASVKENFRSQGSSAHKDKVTHHSITKNMATEKSTQWL